MMIKYRVHEVAKDLNVPSKEIIDLLQKHFGEVKKHMTALTGDGRSGIMADDGLSFADCFFGNMLTLKASVCKGLLDRGNNAGAVLTHQLDYFAKNNIK